MSFINEEYRSFAAKLEKAGFHYVGSGASRNTYLRKKVVVKIPRSLSGLMDNISEAFAYGKYRNRETNRGMYLAPARLLSNGCLMMMAVERDVDYDQMPYWARSIDGAQVGLYRERLVAYDYAHDISEGRLNDKFYARVREFETLSLNYRITSRSMFGRSLPHKGVS